jgi:type IV pilus assembly protein PilM
MMAKTLVGLEITEESVRAVEVTAGRRPVLVASGEIALPAGAARDSEVLDQDAVALALRQLWSRAGFRSRRVVLGIGSRRVLVREFTTQALRPDLLTESLPFQVQDLLPVPASQAVLDFLPIAEADGQVSGLLVAAVSETVESLIATLAKARLRADAVDFAPFGLARAARTVAADGETVAMVHVGDHTSYVVIVRDGLPLFVRILPIDIPTVAVMSHDGMAEVDAALERIFETVATVPNEPRVRLGAGSDAEPHPPVPVAAADLASRVRSTLAFFASRAEQGAIDRVLLSGAGADALGVRDALDDAVDVEVVLVSAADLLASSVVPSGDGDPRDFVSTIGLVLAADAA